MLPFALWPLNHGFEPWQILSSAFLHGGLLHLATNMYGLWLFGSDVERTTGSRRFAILYFASVVSAALLQLTVTALMSERVPTLGASGGIFGVLVAFAMLFPDRRIILIFPPLILKARTFVLLYAGIELFSGLSGFEAGVAHFAHIGGLIGGYLVMSGFRQEDFGEEM
jgi:membrane associated rhomboid family serine protease